MHAWSTSFFSYICSQVGRFVCCDENTESKRCLEVARIQVATSNTCLINKVFKVKIDGAMFMIRAMEEFQCTCHYKNESQSVDDEESVSCWESDADVSREPAPAVIKGGGEQTGIGNFPGEESCDDSDARKQESFPKSAQGPTRAVKNATTSKKHIGEKVLFERNIQSETFNAEIGCQESLKDSDVGEVSGPNQNNNMPLESFGLGPISNFFNKAEQTDRNGGCFVEENGLSHQSGHIFEDPLDKQGHINSIERLHGPITNNDHLEEVDIEKSLGNESSQSNKSKEKEYSAYTQNSVEIGILSESNSDKVEPISTATRARALDRENPNSRISRSLSPARKDNRMENICQRADSKRKSEKVKSKRFVEQKKWAYFAADMISEEDISSFNKDLRNKGKKWVSDADKGSVEEEARNTWEFGKFLGLRGNDGEMTRSLKKLDEQVSSAKIVGKEISEEVSL